MNRHRNNTRVFTPEEIGQWLIDACRDAHPDYTRINRLIGLGASLEETDTDDGLTPLGHAIIRGDRELAAFLAGHGANVNAIMTAQRRPLMLAAAANDSAMCAWLLERGADPDAQTARGKTALIMAAENGAMESATVILAAHANVSARDENGHTAESIARARGYHALASLIGVHAARQSQQAVASSTPVTPQKIILRRKPTKPRI